MSNEQLDYVLNISSSFDIDGSFSEKESRNH